jgi:hypothetical protein
MSDFDGDLPPVDCGMKFANEQKRDISQGWPRAVVMQTLLPEIFRRWPRQNDNAAPIQPSRVRWLERELRHLNLPRELEPAPMFHATEGRIGVLELWKPRVEPTQGYFKCGRVYDLGGLRHDMTADAARSLAVWAEKSKRATTSSGPRSI